MTNHLWQSTIYAITAALVTLVFRKNRAQVRYWIWFSASLKFFIPFTLLLSLGSHLERTPVVHSTAAQSVSPAVSLRISEPFLDDSPSAPVTPASNWQR